MPSEVQESDRKRTNEEVEKITDDNHGPETKKQKSEVEESKDSWKKGEAPIKEEYRVHDSYVGGEIDDDDLEASRTFRGDEENGNNKKGKRVKRKGKNRGQNHNRRLIQARERIKLCASVVDPEDEIHTCHYGADNCKFSHDVDAYLKEKPADNPGMCPVWEKNGYCPAGVKCRWLGSHYDKEKKKLVYKDGYVRKEEMGELNWISGSQKHTLQKRKVPLTKSDDITKWIDEIYRGKSPEEVRKEEQEHAATYIEPPFRPCEKKDLHLKGKKIVAPLTTVGNLPFRRLMRTLGADVTYSEMALCLPLIQGSKSEWALMKAHQSEYPGFGVQLAASKHWQTSKAVEAIAKLAPNVSEFNLNCGCPIDLLFRKGEGSGLMDNPNRMLRILKGMNYCSGDIPVTVKMRMGVRDEKPLAKQIVEKLLPEGDVAAITIHGRSRKQRYTRLANWDYVGETASVVKGWYEENEDTQASKEKAELRPVYVVGNGDCYTYEDYNKDMSYPGMDAVMIGRGALIKPWIFEEIDSQQYLDKTASERLSIIEQYSKFALDHWGSDEFGVNTARRYMCEFLSFTYRYVPVGLLERLPPKLNQRPPPYRGRNELETLFASPDYKDWIKITEMFLGKADDGFSFIPKHKSNSYENPN